MNKFLKIVFYIQLIAWLCSVISNSYQEPIVLLFTVLIGSLIWLLLWKLANYVIKNPEKSPFFSKANLLRWPVAYFFSTIIFQLGVIISFSIRFLIDREINDGNIFLRSIFGEKLIVAIMVFGALIVSPLTYQIVKGLRFKKPLSSTFVLTVFWTVLIPIVNQASSYLIY